MKMPKSQKTILLAAIPDARDVIAPALANLSVAVISAGDYDEAVSAFEKHLPDVVIVTYFFDHLRAYRFVKWMQEVRAESRQFVVVLVRVMPMHLPLSPEDEKLIEAAYLDLGADHVFDLQAETTASGTEGALTSFTALIEHCLAPLESQ